MRHTQDTATLSFWNSWVWRGLDWEPRLWRGSAFLQGLGEVRGDASSGGEHSPLPCSTG